MFSAWVHSGSFCARRTDVEYVRALFGGVVLELQNADVTPPPFAYMQSGVQSTVALNGLCKTT